MKIKNITNQEVIITDIPSFQPYESREVDQELFDFLIKSESFEEVKERKAKTPVDTQEVFNN